MQMPLPSCVRQPGSVFGWMWNWPAALVTGVPLTRILPAEKRSKIPQADVIDVLLKLAAAESDAQSAGRRERRSEFEVKSRSRAKIGSRVK
jgi:hypothetical protein